MKGKKSRCWSLVSACRYDDQQQTYPTNLLTSHKTKKHPAVARK
ncbi:hypothetical protein [Bernardetia litoralis]|nr:hypothetical protein [Bernardetia litoralis]